MRYIALLFVLIVGACAALFIVQTGQFSQPAPGAPAAEAQPAPDAEPAAASPAAAPSAQPPAGGQSPGDVVASLARNTRAVAASAAKSPRTVSASLTPTPQPAAAPAPKPLPAGAVALLPMVRIVPPQGMEGIAFGMSADQISRRFPPSWRRETRDELVLVYYPDNQGDQVRFHFTSRGLSQLELQMRAPNGETLNQFYQRVKQQYAAVYGGLPGTPEMGWNDGQTVLQVKYGDLAVSVCYSPRS